MRDQAYAQFCRGQVLCDPYLLDLKSDTRTGLAVIARLNPNIIEKIQLFLTDLNKDLPDQYCYPESDLHLTVLSLFTVTADYQPFLEKTATYQDAVTEALHDAPAFYLQFRGVTASPGAVVVQGFNPDSTLNRLRDRLRDALIKRELGAGLDQRYKLETAHATVFRFQNQPQTLQPFLAVLARYREFDFGDDWIREVVLVENDWYMRDAKVQVLKTYSLGLDETIRDF